LGAAPRGGAEYPLLPPPHAELAPVGLPKPVAGARARFYGWVDPRRRRGRSGRITSGSTAYPRAKSRRDSSMPPKRGLPEDVYGSALQDPRDTVKAELLESQSPVAQGMAPRHHVQCEAPA